MDPRAALDRIAFLLERRLAPSFKVQAFRRAAETIAGLDEGELRERVADGRLKRTRGIGDSTFKVIVQALDGGTPDYLASLEKDAGPLVSGGEELLSRVRGDLHAHTDWSDGGSPLELMASTAAELGREYQAITDHSPNLTIAHGLDADRLRSQLDLIDRVNEGAPAGFRLLPGIEVDILEDGSLDQTDELLRRLDVVVASVHSKLRSERHAMTRRMLAAIENPRTDVLGHCTGRLVKGGRGTRPPSEFDAERVFAACAENRVAVEINSRPERQDPPDELIALALEKGCLFSIDTDAHAPGQLDFLQYGAAHAAAAGVPADRIVTTWPLADLTAWTHRND